MGKKKNVLIFMCDQLKFDALGFMGNSWVKTPNLDNLAKKSVVFENAFCASPVCCPSRMSFFTGLYPHVHGVEHNHDYARSDVRLLQHMLKEQGYKTAASGKLHFKPTYRDWGFDFLRFHDDIHHSQYYQWLQKDHPAEYTTLLSKKEYNNPVHPYGIYKHSREISSVEWVMRESIRFLEFERDSKKPFFLFSSWVEPHTGYFVHEPFDKMYKSEDMPVPDFAQRKQGLPLWKRKWIDYRNRRHRLNEADALYWQQMSACYHGIVSHIDWAIGQILNKLEGLGLCDSTVIVFTSDHGELLGQHGLWGKGPFEIAEKVPFVIYDPRLPECKGKRITQLVSHIDVLPTLFELIGLPLPPEAQGESLVPLMQGNDSNRLDEVYIEYLNYFGGQVFPVRILRSQQWKFRYYLNPGTIHENNDGELYDLQKDYGEIHNLYDNPGYSHVREDLKSRLFNWVVKTQREASRTGVIAGSLLPLLDLLA